MLVGWQKLQSPIPPPWWHYSHSLFLALIFHQKKYGGCDKQVFYWVLTAQARVCTPPSLLVSLQCVAQGKTINSSESHVPFLPNGGQNGTSSQSSPETWMRCTWNTQHKGWHTVEALNEASVVIYTVTCFWASGFLLLSIMLAGYLIFDSLLFNEEHEA